MNIIKIHKNDSVVIALKDIPTGTYLKDIGKNIVVQSDIPRGHKIAIKDISINENILKYGMPIGHAVSNISIGQHVHTHNIKTNLAGILEYQYSPQFFINLYADEALSFKGYKRENGEVGIRNELWIIPTVGCINSLADLMIKELNSRINLEGIDGIHVFKHPYGCSQLGEDLENTRTILQDLVKHPNTGGVLVFGLGCENNIVHDFETALGCYDSNRIKFLVAQEVVDELEEGSRLLEEIYLNMKNDIREEIPLSQLKIGLKCGGSDSFSGITANPLLGWFSDWFIAQGGTTVLTEVPEMFGAETLLMNRAQDKHVYDKIVHLINSFKEYFLSYKQPIFENPSPGNKDGGISSLEDKALGCIQKCGTEKIIDVLAYGDRIKKTGGVNLIAAPGNDGVSSTVLGAAGCHMILFTTGRGTPLGTFVPTLKVATNTTLANRKPRWIDFNAGKLLDGIKKEQVLQDLIDMVIAIANGQEVNNEKQNFRDITIFKDGVTL